MRTAATVTASAREEGGRVRHGSYGAGTVVSAASAEQRYAGSTVAVVAFDSGRRLAVLAKRLREATA